MAGLQVGIQSGPAVSSALSPNLVGNFTDGCKTTDHLFVVAFKLSGSSRLRPSFAVKRDWLGLFEIQPETRLRFRL